jgi:6-phosphogluconolactonase
LSCTIPFFIGTYTEHLGHVNGRGPGIIPCELDLSSGKIRVTGDAMPIRNPAYLWSDRDSNRLYATSEIYDFGGNRDGSITVFERNKASSPLRHLQEISSAGCGPAWVRGDSSGRWLFVANYIEGNVAVFPIHADGTLGETTCRIQHSGSGPVTARQEAAHPHAILASADNRHVYVADLGTDTIHGYEFESRTGQLKSSSAATHRLPPGSGPRHLLFPPDTRLLLVVLELSSELAVLERNPADGSLKLLDCRKTTPADFAEDNHPSELAATTDGRFVYVANRGHNSIAVFALDAATGQLNLSATVPCEGKIPRHIALTPDNHYLLAANQESNFVVAFKRDSQSGTLSNTGQFLRLSTPCFIQF